MRFPRPLVCIPVLALLVAALWPLAPAQAQERACNDTAKLARLRAPLFHMARRVAADRPLTILARSSLRRFSPTSR